MRSPRYWLTLDEKVGRRDYFFSAILLVALKYCGDMFLVWRATGNVWQLRDYVSPVSKLMATQLQMAPGSLLPFFALWSLPFLWIGITMSMRRVTDAGYSPWLSLLFFVPVVNVLMFVVLSSLPSRRQPAAAPFYAPSPTGTVRALQAMLTGATVGLVMLALSIYGLQSYGAALFLGTPFVIGAVTAFVYNRGGLAGSRATQQVVLFTIACVGGVALLTAVEGAVCLFMAAPLAVIIAAMGAKFGRHIARIDNGSLTSVACGLLALPLSATIDAREPAMPLREVRSSIVIDASPMDVWKNVIAFPPLPEPSDLVFRTGIAYPKRAEILGEGVGAVRRCVFSTGAFVEPITRWEPGRRLSFDVDSQPRPMEEWSPYANLSPPHMDGYFSSRRGEFRLIALPNGRTRLEGSTWYEMRLQPAAYWVLYGDAIIGRIHRRVLEHIRDTAEHGRVATAARQVDARNATPDPLAERWPSRSVTAPLTTTAEMPTGY